MKRSQIKPGSKSLARGSTFKAPRKQLARTQPTKRRATGRAARRYRPGSWEFRQAAQQQLACMNPRCPSPSAPWNPHHVVYKQHIRDEGGDVFDPRDAMRLCVDCHANYHAGSLRLPADVLPPAAAAFAVELLGPERAALYMARYYGP